MKIRKEDIAPETQKRILDRTLPLLKENKLTPEMAQLIVEEEYVRQMIAEGKNIEFKK